MPDNVIEICDPHFHMWDLPNLPNPNLGSAVEENLPTYLATNYEADAATLPRPIKLVSRVHVETIVGQTEGGVVVDPHAETRWVCRQLAPTMAACPARLVAYVNLSSNTAEAERAIDQHVAESERNLCGVRMILNHHRNNPDLTWPQVEGDILSSSLFREGLGLLEDRGLTFDLSCNPHQIPDAVKILQDFPNLRVVKNHLGFLHDGENKEHEELWRNGLHALANLPNVFIKLSMLWFARNGFHEKPKLETIVRGLVQEIIETFGPNRCMFASNYPVDKVMGISLSQLYKMFLDWTDDLGNLERKNLFHDTAVRAYNLK